MQITFNSVYSLSNLLEEAIENKKNNDEWSATTEFTQNYMVEKATEQAIEALVEVVNQSNKQSCRTGKLTQEATVAVSDFVRKMTGKGDENAPLTPDESAMVRSLLEKANATVEEDDTE